VETWPEVESVVYCPGKWIALTLGTFFTLVGVIGFFTIGDAVPPGLPVWIGKLCTIPFALLGGIVLVWALWRIFLPVSIRHAVLTEWPDVPMEPVAREGSVLHARVTHELAQEAGQWEFRPHQHLWRNDLRSLIAFGIVFLTAFAGLLTWIFHRELNNAGWAVSAICAIGGTVFCGVPAILLIGLLLRSGYRQLCRLSIPGNGDDLELDLPHTRESEKTDLAAGLRWTFVGETKRQCLAIPRELVSAVQLCPWHFVLQDGATDAVQGLLVLKRSPAGDYYRLPILLTSDVVGGARLLQRLATTLQVPYLFCADAAGWRAEGARAKTRPPLKHGGTLS